VIPNARFLKQARPFWANVRTISQAVGYTVRGEGQIKVPTLEEIVAAYKKLGLRYHHISAGGEPTTFGRALYEYFTFRADRPNSFVEPRLMKVDQARKLFEEYRRRLKPKCPLPMNKQKGTKKAPAYLTGLVNMLIEANGRGLPCDYDPRELTTITRDGVPLRTLAQRGELMAHFRVR
jgi:hypothetical protein